MTPVKFEVDALVFDVHICSKHNVRLSDPLGQYSIGPIVPNEIDICTCPPFGHDFWCKKAR